MATRTIVDFPVISTETDFETQFAILGGYRETMDKKEYAETALYLHYLVATSENATIASSRGNCYPRSRQALLGAINVAYPKVDVWAVYDMWCDCNEDVKYCVEYLESDMQRKLDIRNHCRIWHIQCNPDDCYMPDEMPKGADIYRNGDEWSAGN